MKGTVMTPVVQSPGTRIAGDLARRWVLRDGSSVAIVPICAGDAERLVRFHHDLSPITTYRRFFCVHPELSEREVERFTHVDHADREALVAVDGDEIVAVARLERLAGADRAEVAFVVADEWQGRGLGGLLFDRLAVRARQLGISTFEAETLPENQPMLAIFRHAGGKLRMSDGVVTVTVDLTAPPAAAPS